MRNWGRVLAVSLLLLAVASAADPWDDMALRDTLMRMGPLMGHRWLEKNGHGDYLFRQSWKPTTDSGLSCVGRWSYGPSLKVSFRVAADDTIICLTRGSGASLIRFRSRDSVTLDLLGDLNFAGIPRRAVIQDTLVIAGIHSGGTGLEVYGVSNPASPNLLSRVDLPVVNDIAVNESLVYVACEDDTLRVYNIANPRQPVLVGACRDSCDLFMTQAGDYCYLVHVSGVNIVDVGDPTNPHRVERIGGGEPLAVYVRDTLCYVTVWQYGLRVYDVSDIGLPRLIGSLSRPDAMDLTMASTCDTTLYTSLLDVISVANPMQPRLVGYVARSAGGVATLPAPNYALLAVDGLTAVDITSPTSPRVDTNAFSAGSAVDIVLDGTRAYVGSYHSGLAILDVANPASPVQLGGLDYVGPLPSCLSVEARDSFAYVCWDWLPQFRSVDVSDPQSPVLAGGCDVFDRPQDMVWKDSLVYVAMNRRLQVINVARPRSPVLVGSCVIPDYTWDMDLEGDLACVANTISLQLVDVAQPDSPRVVGSWPGDVSGVDIVDTIAYVTAPYTGYVSLSIANPAAPYVLDSVYAEKWWNDIVVDDSLVFAGGTWVQVLDVSDPKNMRLVGSWVPPYLVRRLEYHAPYLYAACYEAGVCILETAQVSISEGDGRARPELRSGALRPNPASKCATVRAGPGLESAVMRDVLGRTVRTFKPRGAIFTMDLTGLQSGLYFVELRYGSGRKVEKLIKR